MQEIKKHFQAIITPLFPVADRFIVIVPSDDFIMEVSWLLQNDSVRKFKRSKKIRLIIDEAQLSDYKNESSGEKKQKDKNTIKYVQQKLDQLDPDHNNPYASESPIEVWHVEV